MGLGLTVWDEYELARPDVADAADNDTRDVPAWCERCAVQLPVWPDETCVGWVCATCHSEECRDPGDCFGDYWEGER